MNRDTRPTITASSNPPLSGATIHALVRAMRPTQWLKNGLVFAGLVFGGKLLDPDALVAAALAAVVFCAISSGFYLINDVRDIEADRLHPGKRRRPVAAGDIAPKMALATGITLILVALAGAVLLGSSFLAVVASYAALMSAYNLGLKDMVILDVFAIAAGFVLRAIGGAVVVDVSISPWLLLCTMFLALLVGFGKRRYELVSLPSAGLHRRNLDTYSTTMLDQAVAIAAAGTLSSYAIYSLEGNNVIHDRRFMVTVPIVAYGVFRYLHLLYRLGKGGEPETLILTDRALLIAVTGWGAISAALLYLLN